MNRITAFLLLTLSSVAFSHGGGEELPKSSKGVLEYNEKEGFRLSEPAFKRFKISTQKIVTKGLIQIPRSALVTALGDLSVYRERKGHFKRIDIKLTQKNGPSVKFESSEFVVGDAVVTTGADFLRVTEMDLTSGDEDEGGHHHD